MKIEDGNKVKTSRLPKVNKKRRMVCSPYMSAITHGGTVSVDVLSYVRMPPPEFIALATENDEIWVTPEGEFIVIRREE